MIRGAVIFFILFLTKIALWAQYINTDELVFVLGYVEPITVSEFEKLEELSDSKQISFLSQFLTPGDGGYIISRYGPRSGRMHYGTDIKMNKGDTVVAANEGFIERSNYGYGFGNLVVIRHKNNLQTYYAHLSKFLVKRGKWVAKGEPIGLAGSTGRARGNHLHFEIRENRKPFDPELLFDFENLVVRNEATEANSIAQLHRILKPKGYSKNVAVPEYYRVRSGDSLWKISRKFKTSINSICRLNHISENSVLQIGQPLKLY
ncbi:MAG: peptidoglycan DD-metalloendopeptidase family protein [Bacteroidota bacterium]